jgi:fatty acid-binding protein DegV
VIITDTSSELEKEFRDRYEIDYVPMPFALDGVDYEADMDWQQISASVNSSFS